VEDICLEVLCILARGEEDAVVLFLPSSICLVGFLADGIEKLVKGFGIHNVYNSLEDFRELSFYYISKMGKCHKQSYYGYDNEKGFDENVQPGV
jgi:hypothetical protein